MHFFSAKSFNDKITLEIKQMSFKSLIFDSKSNKN